MALTGAAALGSRPALAQASTTTLRFVPVSDLSVLDPVLTSTYITRNHAYMVFDHLYGLDEQLQVQPQMADGHRLEKDGRRVTIRLREGLRFHDGEPVRARDAVASIRRWAQRDQLGQTIMALTDELAASGDRDIVFRLRRRFRCCSMRWPRPRRRCASSCPNGSRQRTPIPQSAR